MMRPRASLRKVAGVYEHELNAWLDAAIPLVRRVIDVGANDGYFSFGCAAAFRRLGIAGEIVSFEPQATHAAELMKSLSSQPTPPIAMSLIQMLVGEAVTSTTTTLDAIDVEERRYTLIKIDVEGAERDVIAGGGSWMNSTNLFLIEVHKRDYIEPLQSLFERRGLRLRRVDQHPLPLLGRETREDDNCWLVSELPN